MSIDKYYIINAMLLHMYIVKQMKPNHMYQYLEKTKENAISVLPQLEQPSPTLPLLSTHSNKPIEKLVSQWHSCESRNIAPPVCNH